MMSVTTFGLDVHYAHLEKNTCGRVDVFRHYLMQVKDVESYTVYVAVPPPGLLSLNALVTDDAGMRLNGRKL